MPLPVAIEIPLPWGPTVRGMRWGPGLDVVLLLHEPGADLDAWGTLPASLARALNVQAVAVDLPGHGLSDDPWEEEKTGELVKRLTEALTPALTPLPSPPIATGEGEADLSRPAQGRWFVVAAETVASVVLSLSQELGLSGQVALSPTILPSSTPRPQPTDPLSPIATGEGSRGARATLFIAGSLADADLESARRLAAMTPGWTVVTSVPVAARGTTLLTTLWRTRIAEDITAFLRDCQRPRSAIRPGPRMGPRLPI